MRVGEQIKPGSPLDEELARLISQRESIKVVLAGTIAGGAGGYTIRVRAIEPVEGTPLATVEEKAATKAEVLQAVGRMAARIRRALGDAEIESNELTARETFTAASLEAARDYSQAQLLNYAGKDEEAIAMYRSATEKDPEFGRAYTGWATVAYRLGQREEAERLYKIALAKLDRMTEREKYRTLGAYYAQVAGSYDKAVENYSALVAKYPSDGVAHNNLAVAYFSALNFAKALEEGRQAVEVFPKTVIYRYNYALFAMYAGEFPTAAEQAREALALNAGTVKAYLALAMSALAEGRPDEALATYDKGVAAGPRGISLATIGKADVALAYGRPAEAIALLQPGITKDEAEKSTEAAASKRIVLAEAFELAGRRPQALAEAEGALRVSKDPSIVVPAAGILIRAGREREARELAAALARDVQPQSRAYAKVIEAQILLQDRQFVDALDTLKEAKNLADLWLVRYHLGIAYVSAGRSERRIQRVPQAAWRSDGRLPR
jgi:tetratricopeptide (TPR) repeat protein